MAANMYRVGDYVYFETSSTTPYQIRRIEELCKTGSGNVEAKVMCFYRRRDISSSLILLADKHQSSLEEDYEDAVKPTKDVLSEKQQHQVKHRELFLSRQVETLPATHIRGKCSVTLLNETESLLSYLIRDDSFFYSLVYDPQQKTLLADKGEIRVGPRYQAEPMPLLQEGESDGRNLSELEELVWDPTRLPDDKLTDSFLVITRSIGTFARALDCTSTVRQPSLHMSAAAASRDITLFHAMDVLHAEGYDVAKAICSLVPRTGPVLCRDEMEEWSASEANLFEEALDKYGKDFADIRQDFLPWKTLKSVVEYYYMWKTTDRYVQQKRIKAAEAESKLKQVYIPNYNKPNPAQILDKMNGSDGPLGHACESCYTTQSSQWFSWGPVQMQCRLCATCWTYWKKYGGLKMPTRLDGGSVADRLNSLTVQKCTVSGCGKEFRMKSQLARHLASAHGLVVGPGSPCPVMKTRAAFCLVTTPLTRVSRRICRNILNISRAARRPFVPISIAMIKQECQQRLPELAKNLRVTSKVKRRVPMEDVSARLGVDTAMAKPVLLQHTAAQKQAPLHCAFPRQPQPTSAASPSSLNSAGEQGRPTAQVGPSIMRKRGYEHVNGIEGAPPSKYTATGVIQQTGSSRQVEGKVRGAGNRVNGRGGKDATVGRTRKHIVSWVDTPDDVYFVANIVTRKLRRQMSGVQLKRAARHPWNKPLSLSSTKSAVNATATSSQSESVVVLE